MDLHKFAPDKYVVKLRKQRRKFGAEMVNATFAWLFAPSVFWYANVAFIIFAPYLFLSFYIFATYLKRGNLPANPILSSSGTI